MTDEKQSLVKGVVANDVRGKVVLVTGSNCGIGKETALALARDGAHVVMACRNASKAKEAMDDIKEVVPTAQLTFLKLDLNSLKAVRESAEEFKKMNLPLDVLINNAGLAAFHGVTVDGFETTFGVNHLGHFLFTKLLLPILSQSSSPRLVIVASKVHYDSKPINWSELKNKTSTTTGLPEYAISKLCNVLHGKELAERYPNILVSSLHPGVVASDVWRGVPSCIRCCIKCFMISNADGAKTTLHCVRNNLTASGLYYDKEKEKVPSKLALDKDLAKELWQRSEEYVREFATPI
eukprot:TRINITY_DN450_c0_g2_i3.p1 TRINITY_DN450_c0_g2~~TRINITY_DN450_c0_g2_i3.p1  ORF type:complete len:294 (+),score=60.86 TRINITY_DN450_c0_g2_i3:50-931(+)